MTNSSTPIRIALTAFSTSVALALLTAVPSETAAAVTPETTDVRVVQELIAADTETPGFTMEKIETEPSKEWLKAQEDARLAAEAAAEAAKIAESARASNQQGPPTVFRDVPSGVGAQGIVDAALAQLGVMQDCTDLVQNSIAAIGLTQRRDQGGTDLGTGIWQYDHFGTRVDINALAPGDILIYGNASSGTHVAIYIGNGQAVHGGWAGNNTAIGGVNTAYQPLTGAIRVG